jgi:spore coat protein U-like protein
MKTKIPVLAFSFLASALAVRSVAAATASASFSVSATVQASCVAAVTATAIKTYNEATDAASAVSVDCSNSAPYSVSLDSGLVHDAAVALRPMTRSRFALLGYPLSSNPRGIANWGQAVTPDTSTWFGSDLNSLLVTNRRYSAAQCATPGAYLDTMIVVVTY